VHLILDYAVRASGEEFIDSITHTIIFFLPAIPAPRDSTNRRRTAPDSILHDTGWLSLIHSFHGVQQAHLAFSLGQTPFSTSPANLFKKPVFT
jgi:hypothetical protein